MKELIDVLDVLNQNNIKKGAVVGAGVGLAVGDKNKSIAEKALIGASLGALATWALGEFDDATPAHTDETQKVEASIASMPAKTDK